MAPLDQHTDALSADDIDAMRLIFDRFCASRQKSRSDADMEMCANLIVRLYQAGEHDPDVLIRACEASLDSSLPSVA